MPDVTPYLKAVQLARGERRYRRKVASPKQWQAIQAAKAGPCRCAYVHHHAGTCAGPIQLHHLIPRDRHGDDVADNLVPVCQHHHELVERRRPDVVRALLSNLTDSEYAYAVETGGEQVWERVYQVRYLR